jgi:lysyl-tRNA synthetase class 2
MDDLREQRLRKRQELIDAHCDPYGRKFVKTASIHQLLKDFDLNQEVEVAGRVMLMRGHGKTMFADLRDDSGKIQLYIRKDTLGDEAMALAKKIDVGDFISVKGKLFLTRTKEKTIFVDSFQFLSKSILPLPEKFHGLKDMETRYRQRYVDLIMNQDVKERFRTRSKIVRMIRRFLDDRDFIEVETPMMQSIAGGAAAKPFVTHHNTLDMALFLRIAPELYLKRLLVGGFEKVYEINRNFRNEGISPRHNPEFTMLELYSAYDNYEDMMNITEEIVLHLINELWEGTSIKIEGTTIDFQTPWRRLSMKAAVKEYAGIDFDTENHLEIAKKFHMNLDENPCKESVMGYVFEEAVEDKLINPTFIIDFPTILCPLSKTSKDDPAISERFELIINRQEIANAYSELNDPIEQANRFKGQSSGCDEEESYSYDEDFVRALEYGMPPAGGLGIGIDRLVMLLTGVTNIREVILFPQLRRETT